MKVLKRFIRELAKAIADELPGRQPRGYRGNPDPALGRYDESPTVRSTVSEIYLHPGQTITVWMGEPGDRIQIELRTKPAGNHEIFLDSDEPVVVREFSEWSSLESNEGE